MTKIKVDLSQRTLTKISTTQEFNQINLYQRRLIHKYLNDYIAEFNYKGEVLTLDVGRDKDFKPRDAKRRSSGSENLSSTDETPENTALTNQCFDLPLANQNMLPVDDELITENTFNNFQSDIHLENDDHELQIVPLHNNYPEKFFTTCENSSMPLNTDEIVHSTGIFEKASDTLKINNFQKQNDGQTRSTANLTSRYRPIAPKPAIMSENSSPLYEPLASPSEEQISIYKQSVNSSSHLEAAIPLEEKHNFYQEIEQLVKKALPKTTDENITKHSVFILDYLKKQAMELNEPENSTVEDQAVFNFPDHLTNFHKNNANDSNSDKSINVNSSPLNKFSFFPAENFHTSILPNIFNDDFSVANTKSG